MSLTALFFARGTGIDADATTWETRIWKSRPSASAPGPLAARAGPSPGGRRTMTTRSPPSTPRSTPASTGSTPPPSTAWAIPKRSSPARSKARAAAGPTSSPSARASGTSTGDRQQPQGRLHPPRVRGQPAPAQGRDHRPLPDPLARARSRISRKAGRTLGELQREGKVRWIGVSNFDAAQMERAAGDRPDHVAPAALFPGEPQDRAGDPPRGRPAWDRSPRLLTDGLGPAFRRHDRRARRRPAGRRLAAAEPELPGAPPGTQPGAGRTPPHHRRPPRPHPRRCGDRLGAPRPCRHRRHRRCAARASSARSAPPPISASLPRKSPRSNRRKVHTAPHRHSLAVETPLFHRSPG